MKALTLHQPWASLVAAGVKRIETRSWPAPPSLIGQRLAIHAGARRITEADCHVPYGFLRGPDSLIPQDALAATREHCGRIGSLPLGAVVASCVVTDCVPIIVERGCTEAKPSLGRQLITVSASGEHVTWFSWANTVSPGLYSDKETTEGILRDQRPFGDFAPGRWAWLLDDITPTTERCPWCWGKGALRGFPTKVPSPVDPHMQVWEPPCCPVCDGAGTCEPVPARGHQRVWEWTP